MAAFMAKKKADDMREQLRQVITITRGPSAWQELIRMEGEIRKKRQQAIYDQQEYRRKVIEYTLATILIAITSGLIIWGIWFIMSVKGVI